MLSLLVNATWKAVLAGLQAECGAGTYVSKWVEKMPYTSMQLVILVVLCKRMMKRRKSCILASPSAISWARLLSWILHHFISFGKYHFVPWWWRQQVLEKCTSSRTHGMKSQTNVIFTFKNMFSSDFIKITLLLSFMIHFDILLCCMK